MNANVLAILKKGRSRVEQNWAAVGKRHDVPKGKVCAVVALYTDAWDGDQTVMDEQVPADFKAAKDALTKALPEGHRDIIWWNDEQTDKQPVLDLYDRAIAKLESEVAS